MKTTSRITILLAAAGAAALAAYLIRRANTKKMLNQVADEGYETAPDILYPGRNMNGKLHYGPVIPG
ncbi:MAG: hypothetical protein QM791_06620 [Ferruginibacter sp.]